MLEHFWQGIIILQIAYAGLDRMMTGIVKPFNYQGRKFTVKPTDQIKRLTEINVLDYIRNLRTALNQTFEPMGISIGSFEKTNGTLSNFL